MVIQCFSCQPVEHLDLLHNQNEVQQRRFFQVFLPEFADSWKDPPDFEGFARELLRNPHTLLVGDWTHSKYQSPNSVEEEQRETIN